MHYFYCTLVCGSSGPVLFVVCCYPTRVLFQDRCVTQLAWSSFSPTMKHTYVAFSAMNASMDEHTVTIEQLAEHCQCGYPNVFSVIATVVFDISTRRHILSALERQRIPNGYNPGIHRQGSAWYISQYKALYARSAAISLAPEREKWNPRPHSTLRTRT